jgi:hypothetical protein
MWGLTRDAVLCVSELGSSGFYGTVYLARHKWYVWWCVKERPETMPADPCQSSFLTTTCRS